MSRRTRFAIGGGILALVLALSCSVPSADDTVVVQGPDPGAFAASVGGVYGVFEQHCGSIDCHGNQYESMRIYGPDGIRLPNDAGLVPGVGSASPQEIAATYDAIISVEPEVMTQVVTGGGDPFSLLILKKPLGIESHKGGTVIFKGDPSETCILTWLQDQTNTQACTTGAQPP